MLLMWRDMNTGEVSHLARLRLEIHELHLHFILLCLYIGEPQLRLGQRALSIHVYRISSE